MTKTRVMVFIDAANLNKSAEKLGIRIDYEKLKKLFEFPEHQLIRPYYYTATDNNPSRKKYFDKLQEFGYEIRTQEIEERHGEIVQKGVDIQLAVEMLDFGSHDRYDTVILGSGDQDFLPVVKAVKDLGKIVWVAAFEHSCSIKLKLEADKYINLTEHLDFITYKK